MIGWRRETYVGTHRRKQGVVGRLLTELRRSNAAGTHGKRRKDRYNNKRNEIERSKSDG